MTEGSLVECQNTFNYWQYTEHEQKLIEANNWSINQDYGPKYKEISVVDGVKHENGKKYISLLEYPRIEADGHRAWYEASAFREICPPQEIKIESLTSEPQTI